MGGEDLGGLELDGRGGSVVGDGQDAFAGMGVADAEVVHAAGPAEVHLPERVEAVVAQPVVPGAALAGGFGFGQCCVGGVRGALAKFAVGTLMVVNLPEAVRLLLDRGDGVGAWLLGQPFLQRLMEPLDLALGLGVTRADRSSG